MQTDTAAANETPTVAAETTLEQEEQGMRRLFADLAKHDVPTTGGIVAEADITIDDIVDAGNDLAVATKREMELADGRAEQKTAAIQRLMLLENPETKKTHTATSAERVVEADAEYMSYRRQEHAAVVARIQAEAALKASDHRARLAVVMAAASL